VIRWPGLTISLSDGSPYPEKLAILMLDYLIRSDGSPPTGEWIGFQELPSGSFYRHAVQGYSGDPSIRDLGADIERFRRAARSLGAEPVGMGNAAFAVRALPHVPLAIV